MSRKQVDLGALAKRAHKIYENQKKEWADFCKRKGKSQSDVRKKAQEYRKKYGATPSKRWKNALKEAAKHSKDTQRSLKY